MNYSSKQSKINNINSLAYGLLEFFRKNTGDTYDATKDHFVFNNQGVLSNNRHFIADTRMQAQPNGDATTEGQSILILGLLHMYRGTNRRDKHYLDLAIKYWDSYVEYFYGGQAIPEEPKRWVCNWIVNGKEPVLANYPIDYNIPTHSGFKGIKFEFTNGQCKIPHGTPYFGEYLDIAFFAFDGALAYDSVVARVQAYKDDGVTVDWKKKGTQWDVEWVVDLKGRKIDYNGNILEEKATEEKGTVQLKDHSVQGIHKLNFSPRVPVELGGRLIERNECQHNRPLHVPVNMNNYGNASDAEQWFLEACRILYDETKEDKYYRAWKASEFTVLEYTDIDRYDKFFRRTLGTTSPFTDGISYDYNYTSDGNPAVITYGRNKDGYISITSDRACKHTLEQQSVNFKINQDSELYIEYGGGSEKQPISWNIELTLADNLNGTNACEFTAKIPNSTSKEISKISLPVISLYNSTDESSKVVTPDNISTWGGLVAESLFENGVYDERSALITRCHFNTDGGFSVGSWDNHKNFRIDCIFYRSNTYTNLKFTDSNGWNWYYLLAPTNNTWCKRILVPAEAKLRYHQENTGTPPTIPVYEDFDEIVFGLEDSTYATATAYMDIYCFNSLPQNAQNLSNKYVTIAKISASSEDKFVAYLGDYTITDYVKNTLKYTPGVIPYSNIYNPESYQFDAWRGVPYTGYQYPSVFYRCDSSEKVSMLENMINFMYDSQLAYEKKFGVVGPCMQAYVWNRWDNLVYGDADTFMMENWGEEAWSGYEPRAFYSGANCWLDLVRTQQAVPSKLIKYTENWISWLIGYVNNNNGATPTYFPNDKLPYYVENDFTGHMTGLWLAGACSAYMAGCRVVGIEKLIEDCLKELFDNYIVLSPNHVMNGCWSPAPRASTGDGKECNGMFFGFWGGEILRGLGLYLQYINNVETTEQKVENNRFEQVNEHTLDLSMKVYDTENKAKENPIGYLKLKNLVVLMSPIKKTNYYLEWVEENSTYRSYFDSTGYNIARINHGNVLIKFKCDHYDYPITKYLYLK